MRALRLLAVLGVTTAAGAQDVQLGGRVLPEGSVVESVVALDSKVEWTLTDAVGVADQFTKIDAMRDTARYVIAEVVGGSLQALVETHDGGEWRSREVVGGRTVRDEREPVVGVGHPVRIERTDTGWRHTPLTGDPPDGLLSLLASLQDIAPDAVLNLQMDRSARVGSRGTSPPMSRNG